MKIYPELSTILIQKKDGQYTQWILRSNNPNARFLWSDDLIYTEAVVQRFSVKEVFFEISQNSQENFSARVTF